MGGETASKIPRDGNALPSPPVVLLRQLRRELSSTGSESSLNVIKTGLHICTCGLWELTFYYRVLILPTAQLYVLHEKVVGHDCRKLWDTDIREQFH